MEEGERASHRFEVYLELENGSRFQFGRGGDPRAVCGGMRTLFWWMEFGRLVYWLASDVGLCSMMMMSMLEDKDVLYFVLSNYL